MKNLMSKIGNLVSFIVLDEEFLCINNKHDNQFYYSCGLFEATGLNTIGQAPWRSADIADITFVINSDPEKGKEFNFDIYPIYTGSTESICYMTIDYSLIDYDPEKFLGGLYTLIYNIFVSYVSPYIVKNGSTKSKLEELFVPISLVMIIGKLNRNLVSITHSIDTSNTYVKLLYKMLYNKVSKPYQFMKSLLMRKLPMPELVKYIKTDTAPAMAYIVNDMSEDNYNRITSVCKTKLLDYDGKMHNNISDYVDEILTEVENASVDGYYLVLIKSNNNCKELLSEYIPYEIKKYEDTNCDEDYIYVQSTSEFGNTLNLSRDADLLRFLELYAPFAYNKHKISIIKKLNDPEVLMKVMNKQDADLDINLPTEPLINE